MRATRWKAVDEQRNIKHEYGKRGKSESSLDPLHLLLLTVSPASPHKAEGAYSYAIKCRLPCQTADGSPAAYWKDISFGRVPPIQLIPANFPRVYENLFVTHPPPPVPLLSPSLLPSLFKWFFCSAENSRRRKTRARGLFHSRTTRGKWERDTWKAVFTTRLTRGNGVLRNGKIFSTSTDLYLFLFFFLRTAYERNGTLKCEFNKWCRTRSCTASTLFFLVSVSLEPDVGSKITAFVCV